MENVQRRSAPGRCNEVIAREMIIKVLYTIAGFLIVIGITVFIGQTNYKRGHKEGSIDGAIFGFKFAMDTVNYILNDQSQSDSSITRMTLVGKDTNVYFLSKKNINQ